VSGTLLRPGHSHHGLVLPVGRSSGTYESREEPRCPWIAAKHHIDKFDGTTVMMLLSFQAKKKCKIREVYHGGHFDQQLFAVWNCVHPVQ
jgi:hypothetical protein